MQAVPPVSASRPARSRRGARRFRLPGLALVALGLAFLAAPVGAEVERPEGPAPWRLGGRVGFTVDAAAFPDSTGYALELYVRIPPATLGALTRDSTGTGRMRLTARVRGRFGARAHDAVQEFSLSSADSVGGQGKVVVLRFPASPGPCRVNVRLEDVRSRKRGLIYSGRNVNESATVEGALEIPAPQAGRDMSDLEFVWSEDASATAFRRGERTMLPNPERLYGLFATELHAAFSARARAEDDRPWRYVARILDPSGAAIAQQESTGTPGRLLVAALTFDVSHVPAGGYDLEVKAWQEGDPGALLRRSHFSVAWSVDSWMRNPRDVADEVHFLLQPEAEETFALLHPGEQERFLEDFWKRRDPTPESARNEAREGFLQRIDYANATYSRYGIGRGMFSDQGRVYIRYGEPSEVLHQVMPTGDETLLQVLQQIESQEDRTTGEVRQKGLGGDSRPYEVWIYEGEIPTPPDADPAVATSLRLRKRLMFLFVDEQGLGTYTLRYSTE